MREETEIQRRKADWQRRSPPRGGFNDERLDRFFKELNTPHSMTKDMVSDLAIGGLTFLGGAISGIIGVFHSEFRSRRERQRELKDWYGTIVQLAERVERLGSDDFDGSRDYLAHGLSGLTARLEECVSEAPREADSDVIEAAEALAVECDNSRQYIQGERVRNAAHEDNQATSNPTDSAVQKAEGVREEAKQSKKQVGWL